MKKPVFSLCTALAGLFLAAALSSCTDFTTIGADLLDEDRLGLDFVDTVTIRATTVAEDSILTYSGESAAFQLSRHPFGDFNDPVFGRATAGLYSQIMLGRDRFGFTPIVVPPNYRNAILDSIVLVLTVDTAGFYGKLPETFGIEVYRLIEDIDASRNYYSNASFATQPMPIGSGQFFSRLDTLKIIDYSSLQPRPDSFPHMRIPLDFALGQELMQLDTANYVNDSTFLQVFKGIYLKPTLPTESMVAFGFGNLRSGIYLYYNDSIGQPRQYQYEINAFGARVSSIRHEYGGTIVQEFLQNPNAGDTLVLVQGLSGVNAKLEFPHITSLRGAIINFAQLEIPIGALPGDEPDKFTPVRQLILAAPNSQGAQVNIADVQFSAGTNFSVLFGGVVVKGENGQPDVYRMNVSSQIADIINGRAPNEMYIRVNTKAQTPNRVILNGPSHPLNRMRLRLAFTKP